MFFTPTFSLGSFVPYNNISNFSNSLNLNPFSLWSSNSYYNNPTIFTPLNQFNYNYFGNLPTSYINNEKLAINTSKSVSNTQEIVSATATTEKTRTEEKPPVKPETKTKKDVKHIYLNKAKELRKDLAK
jgi:hypothetical protein